MLATELVPPAASAEVDASPEKRFLTPYGLVSSAFRNFASSSTRSSVAPTAEPGTPNERPMSESFENAPVVPRPGLVSIVRSRVSMSRIVESAANGPPTLVFGSTDTCVRR
jgi:hypothetical protein